MPLSFFVTALFLASAVSRSDVLGFFGKRAADGKGQEDKVWEEENVAGKEIAAAVVLICFFFS